MKEETQHLTAEAAGCRSVVKEAWACIEGVGDVQYVLYTADGSSRELYGTACRLIYCLRVTMTGEDGTREMCELLDIARGCDAAIRLFTLLVEGRVTPCVAEEVLRELVNVL
jgi:hypothetical protein